MNTPDIKNLLSRTVKKFESQGLLGDMERDEAFLVIAVADLVRALHPRIVSDRNTGGFFLIPLQFDRHVPPGAIQLTGKEVPKSFARLPGYHGIAVPKNLAEQAGLESKPFVSCHCCELYLYSL